MKYKKNRKKRKLLLSSYDQRSNTYYNPRFKYLKKKKTAKTFYFLFAIFSISILLLFLIFFYIKKKQKKIYIKKNKIKPYNKQNQIKVCLCTIGKEENLYVKEFVSNYKKIGYDKIFIYDNNDISGENFEDILQNEISEGFVSIINYRGYRNCQLKAYYDCYENNNHQCNWLSFFDMDEFLELNSTNLSVQEFFSNDRFKKCANVKINWVFDDDTNVLYYEDRPLAERFRNFTPNNHIKSTVRGNLSYNYWTRASNPHCSLENFSSCNSSGNFIEANSPFNKPPDIRYARVKHYHKRSFEEYCIKIKRGKPMYNNKSIEGYKKFVKKLIKINKDNKEKMEIMAKIFGSDLNKFILNLYDS